MLYIIINMILIIVESPSKIKKIQTYASSMFSEKVTCMASIGHIGNVSKAITAEDIKKFSFPYTIDKNKLKNVKKIIEVAKKSSKIYLATDPDREGEAIAYRIYQVLLKNKVNKNIIHRITFNAITHDEIEKGIKNARKIDMNMVNSQLCRTCLDQVIGFSLSKKLMKKFNAFNKYEHSTKSELNLN